MAIPKRAPRPARRPRQGGPKQNSPKGRPNAGDFLSSLKIWQKLVLIALAFTVPLLAVVGLLVVQENRSLTTAAHERLGVDYISALDKVLEGVPQHRGLTNALLNGNESVRERRDGIADTMLGDLRAIAVIDSADNSVLRTSKDFGVLRQELETLLQQADTLPAAEAFSEHTRIINERIIPLISEVAANSGLILTPDLGVYYPVNLVVQQLPQLTENLGQLRGYGAGVLARGTVTPEDKRTLSRFIGNVEGLIAETSQTVEALEQANPALGTQARALLDKAVGPATNSVNLAQRQIVDSKALTLDSTEYFNEVTGAIDNYFVMNRSLLTLLNDRITNRFETLQQNQLVQLTVIALILALTYLLVAAIARRISGPINQLFTASTRLSQGDLSARANVSSSDELGVLAAAFNDSVKQLQLKAQSDAEILERNRELQSNIGNFLNVAMDIASGDFTQRGQVSEDVLGNVVDAINLMVEEIGLVLTEFTDTANSVRSGSGEMLLTTEAIATGAQQQAVEAQRARNQVVQVTGSIQQMARDAEASARAAQQALTASEQGQKAVNDTLGGMQNIRREVQGISKRVKTLGERSLEISEIVETISRISSQTNLLALNAAIEAAGAGEAGQRFSVIADEVRKLAEDTSVATNRVDGLIKRIQEEVQEVNLGVEGGTREVEAGYRVATEAGERLKEVAAVVQQAVQFAQSISQATESQVLSVSEVGSSVQSMATLSETSRERVAQGREAAENLQELAERLTESLVRFRLA